MYSFSTYNSGGYPFPSDSIPIDQKDEKWGLRWAQAMYSYYLRGYTAIPFSQVDRIAMLRSYAAGTQDITQYMNVWTSNKKINDASSVRKGTANIKFSPIFTVADKVMDVFEGKLEQFDTDIECFSYDRESSRKKDRIIFETYATNILMPEMKSAMNSVGVSSGPQPFVVEDEAEIEIMKEMGGFKLPYEIANEVLVKATLETQGDWQEVKKKLGRDMYTFHWAICKDYICPDTNLIKFKYIDPALYVGQFNPTFDFNNQKFAGHFELYTVQELRQRMPDVSEDEIRSLAQKYCGFLTNPILSDWNSYNTYNSANGAYGYDSFQVVVFECEWASIDSYVVTKRTKPDGTVKYYREKKLDTKNTEQRERSRINKEVWYKTNWVINSDLTFGFGPKEYTVRSDDKKQGKSSYHVYARRGRSPIERCIPFFDTLALCGYKLQNARATARSNGYVVDFGVLQNIALGGRKLQPTELLKLFEKSGKLIVKLKNPQTGAVDSISNVVKELPGGMGIIFGEIISDINNALIQIMQVTGIDQVTAGQKAKADTTATEINEMLSATENVLTPQYSAILKIKEYLCNSIMRRSNRIIWHSDLGKEYYSGMIGDKNVTAIYSSIKDHDILCSVKMRPHFSAQEKQTILAAATESMKVGKNGTPGIEFTDFLLVKRLIDYNPKLAEVILAKRKLIREKQAEEHAIKSMQMQSQEIMKQNAEKAKEERDNMILKAYLEVGIKAADAAFKQTNAENEYLRQITQLAISTGLVPQLGGQQAQ